MQPVKVGYNHGFFKLILCPLPLFSGKKSYNLKKKYK
jgi:hypothetical protein